jgi:drug/metabolite transporter (DMT)-like permease
VFGELPDAWTIAGAVIIIAAGLYVFYREMQLQRMQMKDAGS